MCQSIVRSVRKNQQQGAALIVSLIMLLLLTLIGVAGMQNTLLQERMVGSMRDRQMAQQAAEAALRYAEAQIKDAASYDTVPNAVTIATTNALLRKIGSTNVSEAAYWADDSAAWSSGVQTYPSGNLDGLSGQPQYKIERLPSDYALIPGTLNSGSPGGKRVTDYRVTVKAVGSQSVGSTVILQSVYRRVDG